MKKCNFYCFLFQSLLALLIEQGCKTTLLPSRQPKLTQIMFLQNSSFNTESSLTKYSEFNFISNKVLQIHFGGQVFFILKIKFFFPLSFGGFMVMWDHSLVGFILDWIGLLLYPWFCFSWFHDTERLKFIWKCKSCL